MRRKMQTTSESFMFEDGVDDVMVLPVWRRR